MKKNDDDRPHEPEREPGVLPGTPHEPRRGRGIQPGTAAEKREDDSQGSE